MATPGDKTYRLSVNLGGQWVRACDVKAASPVAAMERAIGKLKPEHYALAGRLEEVEVKPATGSGRKG
jgi:hypothetical protein